MLTEQFLGKAYSNSSRGTYLHVTNMLITKKNIFSQYLFLKDLIKYYLNLGIKTLI